MVQYGLTEEQVMLQDMVRKLSKNQIEPGADQRDRDEKFSWEMVGLLRENGLLGIDFPEKYGGSEAGLLSLILVIEELSKVDASVGLVPGVQELGTLPILLGANEQQKGKYLPDLSSGEKLAAFGLTEPSGGSDAARLKTRAVRKGDKYILNGSKNFITNGSVAGTLTVYAVTNPDEKPHRQGSVFIVEKDYPGFRVGKHEEKLGIRSSDTVELIFEDCEVPAENLLAEEGQGFQIMMKTLDFSRTGIAAQALGIAAGAAEYAVNYAKERIAFGKPIIGFQGVSFKLADMFIQIEAARQLLYKCGAVLQECPKGMSRLLPEQSRLSSAAKTFCGDVAMWVTVDAVQVLGGYGYSREYPVERYMRDAKITQIYEGTQEVQRLVVASTL